MRRPIGMDVYLTVDRNAEYVPADSVVDPHDVDGRDRG
jgi:hypothetical protein